MAPSRLDEPPVVVDTSYLTEPSWHKEVALALLLGATWKLVMLSGPGQPYATGGGVLIGMATILVWETVARLKRMDRLEPPIWVVAIFLALPPGALILPNPYQIGNGPLSCWVWIVLSLGIWVQAARRSPSGRKGA